ncbi:hypothetical protein OAO74_04075 [Euryarchaeota archaeon]|nr:hypothetical protein [Euryarchaeota archaeon]MDC0555825.1 hypothetical protein [Euryarchaeota archaeon]
MIDRLLFHIFEVIFETIIELIPPKIRKVFGIILIIIGSILTLLIAILYLVAGPADGTGGLGILIFVMMAILSFLIGFKMTFYE